jgi:hypothetical protein
LTSHRFKSRIWLVVHYSKLDLQKRKEDCENVTDWLNNLRRRISISFDLKHNVRELTQSKMNEKEIHDAIKVAQ